MGPWVAYGRSISHCGAVERFRVAIINNLETIPWLPLVAGMAEGLRELGVDVRLIRVSEVPDSFLAELADHNPDLALLPFCQWEFRRRQPYMDALEGVPKAAVLWDDPYDMETGLALAQEVDAIFTPEELAMEFYDKPAFHLPPFVSRALHYPPLTPVEKVVDVAMVGGVFWRPRAQILPAIRALCQRERKNYTEVAGVTRWLAGHTLTNFLHRSRVLLEIPRYDLPTKSNPYQVPCTYTGPRVYIAEQCDCLTLAIGPRQDYVERFPGFPYVDTAEEAVEWLKLYSFGRDFEALPQYQRFMSGDDIPANATRRMLRELLEADVFAGDGRGRVEALLSQTDPQGARDSRSLPGAASGDARASQP